MVFGLQLYGETFEGDPPMKILKILIVMTVFSAGAQALACGGDLNTSEEFAASEFASDVLALVEETAGEEMEFDEVIDAGADFLGPDKKPIGVRSKCAVHQMHAFYKSKSGSGVACVVTYDKTRMTGYSYYGNQRLAECAVVEQDISEKPMTGQKI